MYLTVTVVHQVWSPSPLGSLLEIQVLGPHPIPTKPKTLGHWGSPAICIFSSPPRELGYMHKFENHWTVEILYWDHLPTSLRTLYSDHLGYSSVGLPCGPGGYISYKFPGAIDAIGLGSLFRVARPQDISNQS